MSEPETFCDGCGKKVSPEHLAKRVQRIELASQYRPLRIKLLFLAEAPPLRLESYFYHPGHGDAQKGVLSRAFFDELMLALGILGQPAEERDEDQALRAFAHRGFFLADAVECPLEEVAPGLYEGRSEVGWNDLAHRYAQGLLTRIENSYKPAWILPISKRLHRYLLPLLRDAGLGSKLILYQNLPLPFPHPFNPAAQSQFRAGTEHALRVIEQGA